MTDLYFQLLHYLLSSLYKMDLLSLPEENIAIIFAFIIEDFAVILNSVSHSDLMQLLPTFTT